jgi:hypothetical protein
MKTAPVYIGVAFDKDNEKMLMASFVEAGEDYIGEDGIQAQALREAEEACPGLPIFTFALFDPPGKIHKSLIAFLTEFEVPEKDHMDIFKLLIKGIKGDS